MRFCGKIYHFIGSFLKIKQMQCAENFYKYHFFRAVNFGFLVYFYGRKIYE